MTDDFERFTTFNKLHRLWSKAVGTEDYDKREWRMLEADILAQERSLRIQGEQIVELREKLVPERPSGPVPVTAAVDRFTDRVAALEAALAPLVAIADAYDDNALDPDARKRWGPNLEHENLRPPEQIELYTGRGGRRLLTLRDCLRAREAVRGKP